ncbi:MAG: helix-turn-helix domain-containing protein [Chloroflexota bacterium]|nr:helix-turn-helix domain-containing protein [Chloroflexota bacterium]
MTHVPTPTAIRNLTWTVDEVTEAFGVTPYSVRRMIREGRLESIRVGGRRLIPHRAVLNHLVAVVASPVTSARLQRRSEEFSGPASKMWARRFLTSTAPRCRPPSGT